VIVCTLPINSACLGARKPARKTAFAASETLVSYRLLVSWCFTAFSAQIDYIMP